MGKISGSNQNVIQKLDFGLQFNASGIIQQIALAFAGVLIKKDRQSKDL
jgi:hypothetical protein